MKLVRFSLLDEPTTRSGFFYEEKIYETDGVQPIGIHKLHEVRLLSPIPRHPNFRDFMSFEEHLINVRRKFGREDAPKEWYVAPSFFYLNASSIVGPNEPIPQPTFTRELDFELEVGIVIGKNGSNIPIEEADDYILGFTIINDWTARDVQRREIRVGIGFGKSKDFATSVGPYLVTPDELEPKCRNTERGKVYELTMRAYINNELITEGNLKDMHWTFAEMISYASQGVELQTGDLIGSGTIGKGCILEHERDYLKPGDEVILQVEGLGELRNPIIE